MNTLEIKQRRKKLGMTQKDLAKLLGVSPKTVANYEKGATIPNSKKELLHKVLKIEDIPGKADRQGSSSLFFNELAQNYIKGETLKILDNIPKDEIVAYLVYRQTEFKKINSYNYFINDITRDLVIDELMKRLKNEK